MTPSLERKLEEIATENCYHPAGEHLHALRMGAEIAGEEAQTLLEANEEIYGDYLMMEQERDLLRACLEHMVNVYLVDDYYGGETRETVKQKYIDRLMAEQREKMSEGKNDNQTV